MMMTMTMTMKKMIFDNDRDLGNYDNAHGNANKGGRQFVVSLLSGSNYCG
jgi:hypothetical protein